MPAFDKLVKRVRNIKICYCAVNKRGASIPSACFVSNEARTNKIRNLTSSFSLMNPVSAIFPPPFAKSILNFDTLVPRLKHKTPV